MHYIIGYTGYTESEPIEAATPEEALEKFWDEGMNELNDVEIIDVKGEA